MITTRDRRKAHSVRSVPVEPVIEAEPVNRLISQLKEHPYAALGVAVGLGFIVGRGPASRATARVVAAGMRAAVPVLLAPVAAALAQMVSGLSSNARKQVTEEEPA